MPDTFNEWMEAKLTELALDAQQREVKAMGSLYDAMRHWITYDAPPDVKVNMVDWPPFSEISDHHKLLVALDMLTIGGPSLSALTGVIADDLFHIAECER